VIRGNSEKVSPGGRLIRNFISSNKHDLLNNSDKVIGGPFTRLDPADPTNDEKKSCLDLIIISKDLSKYVDYIVKDKERKISPFHALKNKVTYSDHYSIMTTFKNIPRKKDKILMNPKVKMWNTNKTGGWSKYKELTEVNRIFESI